MKRTFRKTLLVAVALAAGTAGVPAHAGPGDAWVQIGHGEVAGTGDTAANLVFAAIDLATKAAGGTACKPATARVEAYNLSWDSWLNPNTGAIAYVWTGPGSATVSNDCASNVSVTVQVSDYAPAGNPSVVRGNKAPGSDSSASGGQFTAYATSTAWVPYYEGIYMRGESLVEIKVTGSYYNTKAKATLPLGCIASYTHVTPTPTGPIMGESTSGPCE